MKKRIGPCFFAFLAAFFTAAALGTAAFCRDNPPVLLSVPEAAALRAEELMDAVCDGDFSGAEAMLYGTPDLGADRLPSDSIGAMVWNAYLQSLDYRFVGEFYATDAGIAVDVKLISLEMESVLKNLGTRSRKLLKDAVASAENVSDLYDENNEYREDLMMEILQEAARQALEEDVRYTYRIFPLQLVYSEGQWQPVADQVFLNAVSGGMTG